MAWMDVDKLSFPLILRNRRSGDRFRPLGMQTSMKLKDFLIRKKIPKEQKDLIAIISDAKGIVWVAGYGIDDRVKITDATRSCMICEIRYL
jgi:tRNA(Ile)-lysidine synthase